MAAPLEELFAAGTIDASQLHRGSGDLRTQIAGIDMVPAKATQTSPLTALGLAVEKDTTSRDNWAATFLEGRDKVIATSVDAVVHPALRRERGASSPT